MASMTQEIKIPRDLHENMLFSMACECIDHIQQRENHDYLIQIAEYALAANRNDIDSEPCDNDTRILPAVADDYPS